MHQNRSGNSIIISCFENKVFETKLKITESDSEAVCVKIGFFFSLGSKIYLFDKQYSKIKKII